MATTISGILAMFSDAKKETQAAKKRNSELRKELRAVKERLAVLNDEHFGRSSETSPKDETDLGFNGADPDVDQVLPEETRARGKGRRKIPEDIEIIKVDHYPEEMTCCTCGCEMKSIRTEERIGSFRIIPEHVVLVRDIYHTFACNRGICKENKPVGTLSEKYIMKGRGLEAGLIVEAVVQKLFESTATFRMERRFRQSNINLTRQTVGRNIFHLSGFMRPVCWAVLAHVRSATVAHMDETPLRIQAPGTGKSATGYLWAICRDERRWNHDFHPAVYYEYAPSRSGDVAERLLAGSDIQFLQTDGFSGYNRVLGAKGSVVALTSVRCWAHARRKFHETLKATNSKLAGWVKKRINDLYKVEKTAVGLPASAREAIRQENSLPILREIKAELGKFEAQAQRELKKAIANTLNAFEALQQFAFDRRLEIDNNPIERCMRLIALAK